jgi:hypothetical protein
MELQKDLVSRAPRGRQIIAEKSGHYVQFDQPSLIVATIREMVDQIRRQSQQMDRGGKPMDRQAPAPP